MAVNFPDSPSNGDEFTTNGITFVYNSTDGRWDATGVSSTTTTSDTAPTNPTAGDLWFDSSTAVLYIYYNDGSSSQWIGVSQIGTTDVDSGAISVVSDTAPSSATSGKMWFDSSDGSLYVYYNDGSSSQWISVSGPAGADGEDGSSVTSYANTSVFPSSGNSAGDFAFATDTKAVYIWDGTEWDRISAGSDESPVIITEPPTTTQSLSNSGNTSSITMVAQDPEGFSIEYGIAYNTSDGSLPNQLASATTINQSTGEYTFTPTSNTSLAGTFKARLSASDGVKFTTRSVDFSLAFAATVEYLVVAGGGGGAGGTAGGGGGGAGGFRTGTGLSLNIGQTYTVTVGDGGAGAPTYDQTNGSDGGDSVFSTITATGGGGGAGTGAAPSYAGAGRDGGSGGGGRYAGAGGSGNTPSTTPSQGNDGGSSANGGSRGGGGGGGAGGVGADGTSTRGGTGGAGTASSITGSSVTYAGGGGGGDTGGYTNAGGSGGGGQGGPSATAGTNGLGGGGGGNGSSAVGKDGGSGIVIIRTLDTAASTTGSPTITTDGSYNIYSFTANGSITF